MPKILDIQELMEVADQAKVPGAKEVIHAIEKEATRLSHLVAEHFQVATTGDAKWEGLDFVGVCVGFQMAFDDQPCPALIAEFDPGGTWGDE